MNFKSLVFTLRDIKRLLERPSTPGLERGQLTNTYLRLKFQSRSKEYRKQQTRLLGYTVNHMDPENLYFLYQELFLGRIYQADIPNNKPFIIDCGSNIGMSVLFFKSQFPEAKIIAFEPQPKLHEILKENIENNKLTDVEIHQKAVSNEVGSVDFFMNEDNPGSLNMGLVQRDESAGSITVETDILSNYITDRVDLLKLDIEGAEESVLFELSSTNKIKNIDQIICEYHHHIDDGVDRLSHTLSILESAGFGYQIHAYASNPPKIGRYQDIMIYAFNKESGLNIVPAQ